MRVELDVTDGPHRGHRMVIERHATVVVGRAPDAQFPLQEDRFLSRHHFLVEFNPPRCTVRDLGSTNGIKVNGVRVEQSRVRDGDTIEAGDTTLTILIASSGGVPIACRSCGAAAPADLSISAHPGEVAEWFCDACAERQRRFPDAPPGYFIERWIGGGGMGEVFLARREADHRPVAMKVMVPVIAASERARRYFLREMNVLRELRHRNIVAFYEAFEQGGQFQLVMEYVDGKGAREWVAGLNGPLPIATAANLGVQLLAALDHAHRRGFVHRDIKPSNILVMGSPRVPLLKLSDFGLAKSFRDDMGFSGLTTEGDYGGSMGFLSPDHIRDFRDLRAAADIYSAGATLYYLLTGEFPFFNFDPKRADAITMTLEHPSVPIRAHRPDAPELLDRILRRALEKQPSDRWPSAAAMAEALAPLAGDPLGVPSGPAAGHGDQEPAAG